MCNSLLVKRFCVDNVMGVKYDIEVMGIFMYVRGVFLG